MSTPSSYRPRPTSTDAFPTDTSDLQHATEEVLAAQLLGDNPGAHPPLLARNAHLLYVQRALFQGFPTRYISQDASQPWLLFWSLQAFAVLKAGLDDASKQKAIDSIMRFQHPDGGFGGGPGHAPHLLPTYAAVCTLAIVGRPGPNGGWDQIDRAKMYAFFLSLKQPDGSFFVMQHGEVDVRGTYCLLVTAHLLDLLTPELVRGTAAFIASCQTYEGGFASASQPYFTPMSTGAPALASEPRPALGEAHGGYTFCALACWVMLKPLLPLISPHEPDSVRTRGVDERALRRWLASMQGVPVELGGFKGRTNKLVDGCYSWWVGGAFALVDALDPERSAIVQHGGVVEGDDADGEWSDVDESTLNRQALQEYILFAAQHPAGGLRDKPPKHPDAYHTLYCLAGLSAAQHRVVPSEQRKLKLSDAWLDRPIAGKPDAGLEELRKRAYAHVLSYVQDEHGSNVLGGKVNGVNATHPIFNLTITHAEGMMAHFYAQPVLPRLSK